MKKINLFTWKSNYNPSKVRVNVSPFFKIKKVQNLPKQNMNWIQAKRKYPKLLPFGDSDRDGVPNFMDCRPFNKRMHGFTLSKAVNAVTSAVNKVAAPVTKAISSGYTAVDKSLGGILPGGFKPTNNTTNNTTKPNTTKIVSQPITNTTKVINNIKTTASKPSSPSSSSTSTTSTSNKSFTPVSTSGTIAPTSPTSASATQLITTKTNANTNVKSLPTITKSPIQQPTKSITAYKGVPYSAGKTMAVEAGTGRIAREYGLNTQNSKLEDHYFIQVNGQWKDMGIYNSAYNKFTG